MTELVAAFAFGLLIGAAYLGLLWVSVRGLAASPSPLPRLLLGAALRIALVVLALVVVMDGDGLRLLAGVTGFLAMRIAVTTWARAGLAAPGGGA